MLTTIIDKVLAGLLALALVIGSAALWYADHEHQRIKPLQMQVQQADVAAKQAAADRDAALKAAHDAQVQMQAAQTALASATASAASAAAAASDAHGKLAIAGRSADVAKTLDTQLPRQVWDAIYTEPGK